MDGEAAPTIGLKIRQGNPDTVNYNLPLLRVNVPTALSRVTG
jgi:hypothetical protein